MMKCDILPLSMHCRSTVRLVITPSQLAKNVCQNFYAQTFCLVMLQFKTVHALSFVDALVVRHPSFGGCANHTNMLISATVVQ